MPVALTYPVPASFQVYCAWMEYPTFFLFLIYCCAIHQAGGKGIIKKRPIHILGTVHHNGTYLYLPNRNKKQNTADA